MMPGFDAGDHEGNIQRHPHRYGWQAWCLCGWKGSALPNQGLARAQLAKHVKGRGT